MSRVYNGHHVQDRWGRGGEIPRGVRVRVAWGRWKDRQGTLVGALHKASGGAMDRAYAEVRLDPVGRKRARTVIVIGFTLEDT